jgi:hypothetical protein
MRIHEKALDEMMRKSLVWFTLFVVLAGCAIVACGQEPVTFNFNDFTKHKPFRLNTLPTTPYERQRERGVTPQCDLNGTLCGSQH